MEQPKQPSSGGDVVLAKGVSIAEGHLDYSFTRSSGPGGQNVNKTATKAELRVKIEDIAGLHPGAANRLRAMAGQRLTNEDEVLITSDSHRSQLSNKHECLNRLRHLVNEAIKRPKRRKKTKPTRASKRRRLKAKRELSEKKERRRWSPP